MIVMLRLPGHKSALQLCLACKHHDPVLLYLVCLSMLSLPPACCEAGCSKGTQCPSCKLAILKMGFVIQSNLGISLL